MHKRLVIPALSLALSALGLVGCIDENLMGGEPLPEGTEFNFGAAVEYNRTKTYYDPEDVANEKATSWKIFWNYEDPLDHIYIYSPDAVDGRNQASYTVNPTQAGQTNAASVTKDGDYGVQIGKKESYSFYAMYPAAAVKPNSGIESMISATMPVIQTAISNKEITPDPVRDLTTTADMNCALMIADTTGYKPTTANNGTVSLRFRPFATMLDITVNGTKPDDNILSQVRITSVIIEAFDENGGPAYIAGDFTYDFATKEFSFGENASNKISIETMFDDGYGSKVGVLMDELSKFQVRAFMIPNPAVKTLKVKLVTDGARTLTKTLNTNHFKESQIHFVSLPYIEGEHLDFDYTIWVAQLDPNIYISEISLPGSALSFNYFIKDDKTKQTQTNDLTAQFNAGVRVFQFHVNNLLVDNRGTSTADDDIYDVGIADSDGNGVEKEVDADGKTSYWSLTDVLELLQKEMSGVHKNEFCVVCISDWLSPFNYNELERLYGNLKTKLDEASNQGLVATNVTANTTIGDIKGKVVVKISLNGDITDGDFRGTWNQLSGAKVWASIFKRTANSAVFYSPMPFASLPSTSAGGTASTSLTGGMNIIYSEEANPLEGSSWKTGPKENARNVPMSYAADYSSSEHKNFSMTYLGGVGSSTTYSPIYVAKELNKIWLEYIDDAAKGVLAEKPFGWVMVNGVGVEPTTADVIQRVIEHNTEFPLARRSADGEPGDAYYGMGGNITTPVVQ